MVLWFCSSFSHPGVLGHTLTPHRIPSRILPTLSSMAVGAGNSLFHLSLPRGLCHLFFLPSPLTIATWINVLIPRVRPSHSLHFFYDTSYGPQNTCCSVSSAWTSDLARDRSPGPSLQQDLCPGRASKYFHLTWRCKEAGGLIRLPATVVFNRCCVQRFFHPYLIISGSGLKSFEVSFIKEKEKVQDYPYSLLPNLLEYAGFLEQ